jgi:hypothetical protein
VSRVEIGRLVEETETTQVEDGDDESWVMIVGWGA